MTEDSIKARIALFDQFDQTMKKLIEEIEGFGNESRELIKKESPSVGLYGLAFHLAWKLRYSIEICQKYEDSIRNSLLDDCYEKNKELSDRFEELVSRFVPYIERIIDTVCISINDNDRVEISIEKDSEKLLSDNEYLSNLSKELAKNGSKILNIVCFYLRYISTLLIDIKTARAEMDDNACRFLFEREYKEYLQTEAWNDLKDSFIDSTIKYKYNEVEPTVDQLRSLLAAEIEKMEDMSETFGIIEPYLDNPVKLSRCIIRKNIPNIINSPVLELFHRLGRKKLIEEWINQLEEEELCYELEETVSDVVYCEKYSEAICHRTMPAILKLYEGRDAKDWVCFYHVLVFYGFLACDDFNAFNRWLTKVAGKEIISTNNARKIKMSYWVESAKKKWNKDAALAETNSLQQEKKYYDYTSLCDSIHKTITGAKD